MNVRPQEVTRATTLSHPTRIDTISDALAALGRRLELRRTSPDRGEPSCMRLG